MKLLTIFSRLTITALIIISSVVSNAQVNGFSVACPGGTQTAGNSFPVNLSFNWTNTTTSATVVLNYNPALVNYDNNCQAVLPGCMSLSNNAVTGVLTITISSLSACTNTGAISFNVCFRFNCPDTCAGVIKTAAFNGTLTDNFNTTQNANCNTNGSTPNSFILQHYFHSYNSLTAEVTFKAYYNDPTCFRIKNPKFNVALAPNCGGTITQAWGGNYTYTVAGFTITPSTSAYMQYNWDTMYYVVKLPCNSCLGTNLVSNLSLKGDNCNIANSAIAGPVAANYTIPVAPAAIAAISIQKWSLVSPTRFRTRITNTGNAPLNLVDDEIIPLVHALSVAQYTNQPGINDAVVYYDCTPSPGPSYPLVGNAATNSSVPANTTKIRYTINNLQPGNYVDLYIYFDLTSSCSGPVGNPPYTNTSNVTYNCAAPPNACISCGQGGQGTAFTQYNPQPILSCVSGTVISTCKSVGDTVDLCFEFKNVGDAPLNSGIADMQLPGWLQYVPGSATYTGFSPNPTYINATNAKWNLPTIPVGNSTYKICYKAIINAGAVGGTNWIYAYYSGANITGNNYFCYNAVNICAYAAIGIDKKIKGSLDGSFGTSGNGIAGSNVDYEITIRNTGTVAVNNLIVIDRFPSSTPPDLTILGNPNSTNRNSQFNMQTAATPVVASCVVSSSPDPNVCTGWTGVGAPCGPPAVANWTGGNKAYRFLFNTGVQLAPGATLTFTFQLKIPPGTAAGLHACNTAGFNATSVTGGYTINPVESPIVCVEVKTTEIPPGGCCKDLLKKIKETHSVNNDVLTVGVDLSAGPKKLKKVTVSLVQFEVKHPKDCNVCVRDPKFFGNIVPGNSPLTWNTVPPNVPFTHLLQWQDSIGKDWSNGYQLNFTVPLPPKSPIACCCDTINYCLRYTFMDEDCVLCDTTICYTVYNGKDCKDGHNGGGGDDKVCTCKLSPRVNYEGGSQAVQDGGTITLFTGNIPVSLNPNFVCQDQNGKDCEKGPVVVKLTKPDASVQTLTGPSYNYTFLSPGIYTYMITTMCAGKECKLTFYVTIPK
jgi:hypothetical protein